MVNDKPRIAVDTDIFQAAQIRTAVQINQSRALVRIPVDMR